MVESYTTTNIGNLYWTISVRSFSDLRIMRKSISGKTRNTVASSQDWRCTYKRLGDAEICGKDLRVVGFEVDHIQAVVHDGANDLSNYRAICPACHRHKSKLDVQANWKVKRLRGETKQRHKKKIAGAGFPKAPEGYNPWTRRIERQ